MDIIPRTYNDERELLAGSPQRSPVQRFGLRVASALGVAIVSGFAIVVTITVPLLLLLPAFVLAFISWRMTHSLVWTGAILTAGTIIEAYIGFTMDKPPFRVR